MTGRTFALIALGVLALGVWARFAPWPSVFTPHGIALQPTDTHYYVRFAERLLHHFPRYDDFDPFVNPPTGATIYWPPLHALFTAGLVAAFGPERGAALVDPLLGLFELALLLWLARRRLGARAVLLGFCLALLPAVVDAQALGCADHHVHEPMFVAACALLLAEALEGNRRVAIACGALVAASRLFTTFTVALLIPVAGAIALAGLLAPKERAGRIGEAALVVGATTAGALALFALVFGHLFSLEYTLLSGFLPLAALAAILPAGVIGFVRARDRRGFFALLGLLALAVIALPVLRAGGDLFRKDPLLDLVVESLPFPLTRAAGIDFFGAALVLAPFAAFGALRRIRDELDAQVALAFCAVLLVLTLSQARFVRGFSGALCVLLALGLPLALPQAGRPRALAAGLIALALALLVRTPLRPQASFGDVWWRLRPTLAWISAHTPSAGDPWGDAPARYGVVANFNYGHLITLYAERPAVATPFSQAPWHRAGNARASAVLAATDDESAFRAARATAARYVLATPFDAILGHPMTDDRRTLARRLLDGGGLEDGFGPASAHFRLLFDSAEQRERPQGGPLARVFEVVQGALIEGTAPPGAEVEVALALSDRGRTLRYLRRGRADASGAFAIRVAYPSEAGGAVATDGTYRVRWPGGGGQVEVGEAAVEAGRVIRLLAAPKG